jgi:outer membrane protein TolC
MKHASRIFFGLFSLLLLGLSTPSWAEEPGPIIHLDEAIKQAKSQHPLIKSAEEQIRQAEAGIMVARSYALPKLNLNGNYMRTNDPVAVFGMNMWQEGPLGFSKLFQDFMTVSQAAQQSGSQAELTQFIQKVDKRFSQVDDQGDLQVQVQVIQPIFNGGKAYLGQQMAKINLEAMKMQKKRLEQFLTFQVTQAYLGVSLAQQYVTVAEQAKISATEHVRLAGAHVSAGTVVESDLLRAKVHLASIEEMLLSAQNQAELAMFGLKRAMGQDSRDSQPLRIDAADAPKLFKARPVESEDEQIQTALSTRADLKATQLGITALAQQEKLAKSDFLPHINSWFNYTAHTNEGFDNHGDNWMVGASLNLNLFDGLATSGKVKQARSQIAELKQKERDFTQQVILDVRNASRNLKTAQARMAVNKSAIDSALETKRIVSTRYQAGVVPFIQVTDAEVAAIQAETHYVQAEYDAELAATQMELAIGRLN